MHKSQYDIYPDTYMYVITCMTGIITIMIYIFKLFICISCYKHSSAYGTITDSNEKKHGEI